MTENARQQVVISGVGGQGVLFVTRLLAEAAIARGLPVFTSETHGMAQRGGTVISHLKVGDFSSPLIRPGSADGMLVLKSENVAAHRGFLRPDGWMAVNTGDGRAEADAAGEGFDADTLALKIRQPKAVNLIVLGFALARLENRGIDFYCTLSDIETIIEADPRSKPELAAASAAALREGFAAGRDEA